MLNRLGPDGRSLWSLLGTDGVTLGNWGVNDGAPLVTLVSLWVVFGIVWERVPLRVPWSLLVPLGHFGVTLVSVVCMELKWPGDPKVSRGKDGGPKKAIVQTKRNKKGGQTELELRNSDAIALKQEIAEVRGMADQNLDNIKNEMEWSWGRTADVEGKLEKLRHDIMTTTKKQSGPAKAYLAGCSLDSLEQKVDAQTLQSSLSSLCADLKPVVLELRSHLDKIVEMHGIWGR